MFASEEIKSTLNQIDKVRARGVGDHISLPQIVVCGDQSAGKSSVLEGITEIPFPRKDGLCTRFATEIILRHSPGDQKITATITPHVSRDESTAFALRAYRKELSGYDELPEVIEEAGKLMGLKGFTEDENAPPFALDVLRLEVIGRTGLHLTIVDLPGLVSGIDNDDKLVVEALVNSYLENSRTIILAVIIAGSDIETHTIMRAARQFDTEGVRTVGIITKPDLINEGTEDRVAAIVKNQAAIKLKLGYFVLKNPSPKDLETGMSPSERRIKELDFFHEPEWKSQHLKPDRVGIDALRKYLQLLLQQHIDRELPKVCYEISQLLDNAREELNALGQERPNLQAQRLFLTELSVAFRDLIQSATNGMYQAVNSDFFRTEKEGLLHNRLRARVHHANSKFANFMRTSAHKLEIKETSQDESIPVPTDENYPEEWVPKKMSRSKFDLWVLKTYRNARGLELGGNYGYMLLMELFHHQSSRWYSVALRHTKEIHKLICEFVGRALDELVKEDQVRSELHNLLKSLLQKSFKAASAELKAISEDEQFQPITYNHYFTDNVQKARQDGTKQILESAFNATTADWHNMHINNAPQDRDRLLTALQSNVEVDMDEQTCEEAKIALDAYYKVSMKTYVDNVCRQVIERHLISKLPTIFHPTSVVEMTDEEVERVAAEPTDRIEHRKELMGLVQMLSESLDDLES
ncbi:hypothetical protein FQN57_004471 [Myotisia sp. PD_48]|nr:hypothetical protein FQN57_004471 [Myotisia sp. PD_48]